MSRGSHRSLAVALVALGLVAAACSSPGSDDGAPSDLADPGDCIPVDLSVSPEKLDLLTDLADDFNGSEDAALGDQCAFARVQAEVVRAARPSSSPPGGTRASRAPDR